MKVAVVNESSPAYNLCSHKMIVSFMRQGHEVRYSPRVDMLSMECDKAYLSAIFTWDLPKLIYDANALKVKGIETEMGGPAPTAMADYIKEQTGVQPHYGLDERWEHTTGNKYRFSFTSRGCPRNCEFCIVSRLEGKKLLEYPTFNIPHGKNPYICDNNILLASWEHQKLVVDKLRQVRNLDFNSGFDDRIFVKNMDKHWDLYSQLHLERWRFAYDGDEQREPIKQIADYLHDKGVRYSGITVFCLVGGPDTNFEQCRQRLQYLVDIGVSPYPMRYRPLNILENSYTPPGWNEGQMEELFGYYGVPWFWRSCTWQDFRKGYKEKQNQEKAFI